MPMIRLQLFCLAAWSSACLTVAAAPQSRASITPEGYTRAEFLRTNMVRIPFQPPAETLKWLEKRKQGQIDAASEMKAFHDFQFVDRLAESGITFEHEVVDDAAKTFIGGHYDHGTGLAVADIDNDGRLDLLFVNQLGGNQLWRNIGGGRFENITSQAGVGLEDRVCVGASFADVDNDGLTDLFVTTVRMGNVLFRNLGNGRFEDVSQSAGVDYSGHSSGAVFFDYNRDGLLDLFVCNVGVYTTDEKGPGGFYRTIASAFTGHTMPERSEPSLLYQNLGGFKFRRVPPDAGLHHSGWSGDGTFCDLDRDGFPELYVLSMSGKDVYYRNIEGKRFEDATARFFPRTPWGSMGVKFFDYNHDGAMDLFVTDMHSDMSQVQTDIGKRNVTELFESEKSNGWCSASPQDAFPQDASAYIFGNAFYENLGQNTFAERSNELGLETYWPWGVSAGDLNADGFEDLVITAGMGYPFRYGINSVLLNESGTRFFKSEFLLNVEPRAGGKTEIDYFVLDCSGADKDHPLCYHKRGTLTVRSSTSSRSSAVLDLDDDGDLDIVINNMNDRPQILISDLAQKQKLHFLKVQLRGTGSNASGLGAFVTVRAGGRTRTQFHDGKSGYLSQSQMPLYFGLGDTAPIDQVEVLWPSGRRQIVTNPPANSLLRITENETEKGES